MDWNPSRHRSLRASAAAAGAGLFQACGAGSTSRPVATNNPQRTRPVQPISSSTVHHGDNALRMVAPSGFAKDISHVNIGLTYLYNADFTVTNQEADSRRCQRFANTDAQHITDSQDVAADRVKTPKVLMRLRGGCGAARILPHIDFASLDTRMCGHDTLFSGFSGVCAVRLTLLVKGSVPSFADPMVYNEFGRPQPSTCTMNSFIHGSTSAGNTVDVPVIRRSDVNAKGTLWGGGLSALASLTDSPYMPDIQDGILFIEDVGEQPYRIECMLSALYPVGILQKQRAIVFGDFRMGIIRGIYNSSYDFPSIASQTQHTIRVPVLTGFLFDHITNRSTFLLGTHARIRGPDNGGYSVTFGGYPTLNAAMLNLNSLLPPPATFSNYIPVGNGTTEEVLK